MPIFGDDGFRSEFKTQFMTIEFLSRFANSLATWSFLTESTFPVIVARDTRDSGVIVSKLFCAGLNYHGIDVVDAGILPTPALSNFMRKENFALGLMITASHNPSKDNGVKLFGPSGAKLPRSVEKRLEIRLTDQSSSYNKSARIGITRKINTEFKNYICDTFGDKKIHLAEKNILVDCANGALSQLQASNKFGSNFSFMGNNPDGKNINHRCGSNHPEILREKINQHGYNYGVAFDGDGDRLIVVSQKIGLIETEKLAVLFFDMLARGEGQ